MATMKSTRIFATLALTSGLTVAPALAQADAAGAVERVRQITNEARVQGDRPSKFLDLAQQEERQHNVGGWVTITGLDLRDDDHNAAKPDTLRTVLIQDYRLWAAGEMSKDATYYVRGRKLAFEFDTLSGVPEPDFASQEKATLDLAYVDWGFAPGFALRAGRQFTYVGRALVLSADLDGASVTYTHGSWQHRVFGGVTVDRDPNLDTSIVGFAKETQDRDFYLTDTSYSFESGTRVYGYAMVQQDHSRSLSAAQQARDFSYNTVHVGAGAEGSLGQLLHYYAEFVHQGGSMLADGPGTRVDIDANALLAGLLFYPETAWHPLASLELAHGSGDPARTSVTNTFGGKLTATADKNFMYFGTYDGGLALSPRLSDLTVLRAGYQVKPWPHEGHVLPGLLVGAKGSVYWKDETNGVISDPLATLASRYVGSGVDAFIGWRPLSDFSLLGQYGRFIPGSAYALGANDASNRVLLTSTLSF